MNENKDKEESEAQKNYSMKGLVLLGRLLFSGFLVWCTFNYPMSDTTQSWFFFWAILTWLFS
ncbi:MAG: hypothetical protein IJM68_00975 [Synergistaceae bacterium]|nr:hypothetical protein [Synergistaceae bacterium]